MKAFIDLELISKLIKEISSSNYSPTTMSDLSPPPLERSSYATEETDLNEEWKFSNTPIPHMTFPKKPIVNDFSEVAENGNDHIEQNNNSPAFQNITKPSKTLKKVSFAENVKTRSGRIIKRPNKLGFD